MKKKQQKYYVVWVGNSPGIYTDWEQCKSAILGVPGARYKSYEDRELAAQAYSLGYEAAQALNQTPSQEPAPQGPPPQLDSIAVDAACSGNPGVMEYRGVDIGSHTLLFHQKFPVGTNNIGEFLGIVHGLAYLKQHNLSQPLYSDSVNAIQWVRAKQCRTKLPFTPETAPLWDIIHRAEAWLHNNTYSTQILKWDTSRWGEIPADFGRK